MSKSCPHCQTANRENARYCKQCGAEFAAITAEPMSGLIGLQEIRCSVARLSSAMETYRQYGLIYSDRLHTVLIGSAGTGKTRLVHELAALYHRFGIAESSTPIVYDAVHYADFSRNFQENFKKAKGHVLCIENVQKLIPAGYSENVEPIDRLLTEMSKPANRLDPIIVLSGQPQRLREFLSANDTVSGRFPHKFQLPDFTSSELTELTEAELQRGAFSLTDGAREKLVRVFKRILKNGRMAGSEPDGRNAWAALKMAETLKLNYLADKAKDRASARAISETEILLPTDEEQSLDQVLAEIDRFVGMHALKKAVRDLVDEIALQRRRAKAGVGVDRPPAFHIVLTGNPGTGKTTVARVLGQILRAIGVLELGHVIEAARGKMVAQHVGGTAIQVNDLCDRALGGMLFVDEAYTLKQGDSDTFGQEAIDTMLKRMEDDRGKFVVVIAGYPKEIRQLLNSNPGLQSRFDERYRFHLVDYTPDELLSIFQKIAADEGFQLEKAAQQLALKHFSIRCAQKDKCFGNGREARSLLEASRSLLSKRLAKQSAATDLADPELSRILASDIPVRKTQAGNMSTALEAVDRMIGLEALKRELRALISYLQIEKLRSERGGRETGLDMHFVFAGSPGTGKTTVAQILADVFRNIGLLPTGILVEVSRSGLVEGYLGKTALKVDAAVDEALGGVLFIDEAYALLGDSFGTEAINTLLKRMDADRGKFIVIVAGYQREMEKFLNSNAGLRSRFTKLITFDDYSIDELKAIYNDMVSTKGLTLDPAAEECLGKLLADLHAERDASFANARTVRNIFKQTLVNQAARIDPFVGAGQIDDLVLNTIMAEDISI